MNCNSPYTQSDFFLLSLFQLLQGSGHIGHNQKVFGFIPGDKIWYIFPQGNKHTFHVTAIYFKPYMQRAWAVAYFTAKVYQSLSLKIS